jgi:hypothetical protein
MFSKNKRVWNNPNSRRESDEKKPLMKFGDLMVKVTQVTLDLKLCIAVSQRICGIGCFIFAYVTPIRVKGSFRFCYVV